MPSTSTAPQIEISGTPYFAARPLEASLSQARQGVQVYDSQNGVDNAG